jgi:hypothetical protein
MTICEGGAFPEINRMPGANPFIYFVYLPYIFRIYFVYISYIN